ncbi:TonB-dependent receptor plug domain-containing protein [Natronogracilivirga saccharolytica]|uniref:TonB-dependent receptor plug domain-containing protein n=1 Tax=Natronogracilivirga saccharolytica TaxID=2812953 RepID=A0A8J7UWH5_9BACT|nr:TonB-dependent receptor plug domain-containing protein [Natronogracilivirga saccharolytica]MBP3193681.1 TonB-dependent receptor plug domain-containing protein [Natronogracilivirga saccharolytica]
MFRKVLLSLTFCLIAVPFAIAQTGTLTGEVTDSRSGEVLVGVNIFVEELERGAVTNIDGLYSIENIPVGEYNLRITYVGYTVIEEQVTVTEGENVMDYMMVPDLIGLDEMLVTGQQIERQARSLAYSVSRISGEEVARARESNFVDALAGKIPGVDIQSQSGNIGASSRITIRGISSLTGANQPLFVVDGVPISNSNIVEGTSQDRLTGAIDVGNRAGDLNADDIEDITVLRGAAAAALYGQRARNGVILVTTKRGSEARGQTVTVNVPSGEWEKIPRL